MKIRKLLIIITFTLIMLLFGLVSSISYNRGMIYGEQNAESIRESRVTDTLFEEKIKSVSVIKVNNSNLQSNISSYGKVVPLRNILITSEVSGKLEGNFSIKKGTGFRKGDVLFRIKDTDIKLSVNSKKSNLMKLLSSNLADIKLDFPSEYKKWDEFFNSISFDSPIGNFPETVTSREKTFTRDIRTQYISVKLDEEKLKKYTVRAPFDGLIVKSYTDIGANVNLGSPVIDVISNGTMEVELTVNSTEFNFIEIGSKVILTDKKDSLEGTIVRKLDNFVNENTQSMSVFASISDDTDLLHYGMYLNARISSRTINNVCKIPRRAVFSENNVFILNSENKLEIMSVNIIASQGNNVIVDNISNNTRVVIEPLINTKSGTIVNPIIK